MTQEVGFVLLTQVRKKPLKSSYKKRRGGVVRVYKAHIKLAGLQPGTIHKYKSGIARFFNWINVSGFSFPSSLEDLDFVAGEFVNHFFKTIRPWAGEVILFAALNGFTRDAASICKLLQVTYGIGVKMLRERKLCFLPRISWYPWLPAHSCEGKHLWHLFFY